MFISFVIQVDPIATTIEHEVKGLDDREVVEVVAAGIDNALGNGSAKLILKCLKTAHNFDASPRSIKRGEFDSLLLNLVGEMAYRYIILHINLERSKKR
jgi:hypothetical protein